MGLRNTSGLKRNQLSNKRLAGKTLMSLTTTQVTRSHQRKKSLKTNCWQRRSYKGCSHRRLEFSWSDYVIVGWGYDRTIGFCGHLVSLLKVTGVKRKPLMRQHDRFVWFFTFLSKLFCFLLSLDPVHHCLCGGRCMNDTLSSIRPQIFLLCNLVYIQYCTAFISLISQTEGSIPN